MRRDLTEQIAQFMDEQFLDPTITATASRPASITNGIASPAASGDDADALYNDLNTALATFDAADVGTETVHIIMPPSLSRGISTMRNALGQGEFSLDESAGRHADGLSGHRVARMRRRRPSCSSRRTKFSSPMMGG